DPRPDRLRERDDEGGNEGQQVSPQVAPADTRPKIGQRPEQRLVEDHRIGPPIRKVNARAAWSMKPVASSGISSQHRPPTNCPASMSTGNPAASNRQADSI